MPTTADNAAELRLSTGFDSRIVGVSPRFAAMTGWPPEEATGQTTAILFGPWSDRAVAERLTRAVEQGEAVEAQPIKLYDYKGNVFDALVDIEPQGDGLVRLCLRDPGGSLQREAAPAAKPHEVVPPTPDRVLPVLVEALRDGVLVVDDGDHIVIANKALLDLTGFGRDEIIGRPLAEIVELRFPPGEGDGAMGAATILAPRALVSAAAVSTGRGVDNRGHGFRVLTFRASAAQSASVRRRTEPLEARAEVFEAAVRRRAAIEGQGVLIGLIEIVAAEDPAKALGSIWRDTIERVRLTGAAVLAAELQPGELFLAVRDDMFIVLLSDGPTLDECIDRLQAIAQIARHRLIEEGGALAAFEVFGGAVMLPANDAVLAVAGRERVGEMAANIADRIRSDQGSGYSTESVVADVLDEGTAELNSIRSRDLGPARQALARFDERARRWIGWLRRHHSVDPRLEREFDVALAGRVVETLRDSAGQAGAVIVPLHHQSLMHGATADRIAALVASLPLQVRMRLAALVCDLPPDLEGERLFGLLRRLAGVGRGAWLQLDALDARGITGRHEGLLGVAFDHGRLNPMIERDPMRVKQFVERLRAANQPVLVHGVERPEQAALLFNTFSVTLVEGPGCERLASTSRQGQF